MNIKQNKYILNTDITKWKQFAKNQQQKTKKKPNTKKKTKRKRGSHLNKSLMNELVEQIILWNTVLHRKRTQEDREGWEGGIITLGWG